MSQRFFNWNDSEFSEPAKVAVARNVNDLIAIVRAPITEYPSPVRPAGSLHSLNECFVTTGTQVFLAGEFVTKFDLNTDGTITVGAGVTMIDMARALRPRGLQLPVMPEIGNATAGSVSCCGTKDSSVGDGPGQVSSTVLAVKMVKADGTIEDVDIRRGAADAQRMREIRSSYGLFGIIYEVTFRVEPLVIFRHSYEVIDLDPLPPLEQIRAGADAVLAFMQPYGRRILVERRQVDPDAHVSIFDQLRINKRSIIWERAASTLGDVYAALGVPPGPIDLTNVLTGMLFEYLLSGFHASRADCMIDFRKGGPYFDFTFWAFPVSRWAALVPEYLEFVIDYRGRTGFQASIFTEMYLIAQDENAVLSFSSAEDVFTLDMVDHRPNDPLWRQMNQEFNVLAIKHGGCPVLNQTKELTRSAVPVVEATLASRWQAILATAGTDDPDKRFMSAFFASL